MGITSRTEAKLPQRTAPVRASFFGAEPGQRIVVTTGISRSCAQHGKAERMVNMTGGAFTRDNAAELRSLIRYLQAQADFLEAT